MTNNQLKQYNDKLKQELKPSYIDHGKEMCGECHTELMPTRDGAECLSCGAEYTSDTRPL